MKTADTSPETPISTVLVDRSPIIRAGMKHMLNATRFCVCFECSDLDEVPESAISEPSIILLGIHAAVQDLSRIEPLKQAHDQLLIVVLADGTGLSFLAAMDAGADSYVEKDSITTATLLLALDLALSREVVVPMRMLKDRLRPLTSPVAVTPEATHPARHVAIGQNGSGPALSERERMILWHLVQGAPNKQIARELGVAEATVKVHVKGLLQKVRAKNRTQAAMWAIKNGFGSNGADYAEPSC